MFPSSLASLSLRTLTLQSRLLPLTCTTTMGLMQVRGAKRRFDGNVADPYNYLKRKLRKAEYMKFQKKPLMSNERMQKKLNQGLPYLITSLNQVISPIIPLEKFAKAPSYTKLGMQQRSTALKQNIAVIYAGGVIKRRLKKVDPFIPIEFGRKAQEQFIEVNLALQNKDKETLRELTTENAKEELMKEFLNKKFTWEFVEELERPRIVSAHVAPFNTKDNLFAQVVVRMRSKQLLAVYSPNGSVIKGDPHQPKDVIDYVVFERHLVDPERTSWRILTKLPPQKPWRAVLEEEEKKKKGEVVEQSRAVPT